MPVRDASRFRLDPQILADLQIFQAVAEAGGFAAAGRKLGVSQSAVSQRIARLEDRLGLVLFDRTPGRLALTSRGDVLTQAVGLAFDRLLTALAELRPADAAVVRVNCAPSIAGEWLAPLLPDFYGRHPGIDVIVDADQSPLSAARMKAEEIDIGVRYAPHAVQGCVEIGRVAEHVAPVCAPRYMAEHRSVVRLHDETPWAKAEPEAEWADWLGGGSRFAAVVERDRRFNLASLAYGAAMAGQGVAMGRLSLISGKLRRGELVMAGAPVQACASYRIVAPARPGAQAPALRFADWMIACLQASSRAGVGDALSPH